MAGKEGDGMQEQGWKEEQLSCFHTYLCRDMGGGLGQWLCHGEVELGKGACVCLGYRQGAKQLPGEGDCRRGGERATIGTRCPQKLMT